MSLRQNKKITRILKSIFPVFFVVLGILFVLAAREVIKPKVSGPQAVKLVSQQSEVASYISRVPNAQIQIDHIDPNTNEYVIQVFEVKEAHTATFNWYTVNKNTGALKKEF